MSYQNATVLQRNEILYVKNTLQAWTIGQVIPVQTTLDNVEVIGEYWAYPIMTDNQGNPNGLFRGYKFKPSSLPQPNNYAFKVVRIKDKLTGNTDHIMVTLANYLAGTLTATTAPVPIAEHTVCPDASNNQTYEFSIPFKTGGQNFFITVSSNGTPAAESTSCATLAALVTYLNINLAALGTWSADASGTTTSKLKLVNQLATTTIGVYIRVA